MKRKVLKSSLFIFSLVTLTAVGVNATESSTVTSSTNESKTEFKVEPTEDTSSSESEESLQPKTVVTFKEELEENKEAISSERTINSTEIKQDSGKEIEELYEYAISTGKIKRDLYSLDAFKKNYVASLEQFPDIKELLSLTINFNEWFEQINFGAFPDGEGHAFDEKQMELGGPIPRSGATMSAAQRRNAEKFKKDLRKGDIIIVPGFPGHAAIATTNNYILEMSGGGSRKEWFKNGIKNNNHQFTAENWLAGNWEQNARTGGNGQLGYITEWIQIWRVPNKKLADKVANYADRQFWNSNGQYKKNKNIDYLINYKHLNTNPSYCSKLVFNAYWYGSGSSPVIHSGYGSGAVFIPPADLPNMFTKNYKPYKVGTY